MADSAAMGGVVKLVVKTFLEEEHYHKLFRQLSVEWSTCHSLTAAARLMEAYGVKITPEEEKKFAAMEESRMIDNLVMRMPSQSREQFEHFFLQLSFIASTTTRLRGAIEAGDVRTVEEAMESAESMGVLSYIMKMAVAQAGTQVTNAELEQENWLNQTDAKVAPLLQSQAQAMLSQKLLAQARAQIEGYRVDARDKTKSMLANMTSGNEKAQLGAIVGQWHDVCKIAKMEKEILAEYGYEDQIVKAEMKLFEMKKKQLEASKAMLNRQFEHTHASSVASLFEAFKVNTFDYKRSKESDTSLKALEEKLKNTASSMAANAKKTMARVGAGNDDDLCLMCLKAWKNFIEEYNKDKAMNDAIKAAEQKVTAFQNQHKEGSMSVLNKMTSGADSALKAQVFKGWKDVVAEIAQKMEMESQLEAGGGQLKSFASRNKNSAMSVQQRSSKLLDDSQFIFFFTFWKRDIKVDLMRRYGEKKVRDQKDSLVKVKGAVRGFATDLESTLKQGTPPPSSRPPQAM
jgi:hypothetical protein